MTPANYDPAQSEAKWYAYWIQHRFFHSEPDPEREPYCIVIPPPNVTGVLHMGHMLNNTIQDVLIRRARLQGKNALWVPGTDHASIATEAKVVAKLREQGIDKHQIGREAFLEHAWAWTEKHGGIILEQLRRLGASCDWERTCFTMDKTRSASVIKVFVDLFDKGLIYRGVRMVNWDPSAGTAVSDEEVIYKEEKSHLYYLRYKIVDSDDYITIATTRPETILGDTAVCVNPADERFKGLVGKKCIVPLVNREVPIIEDSYVEMDFGTGALKITPAHDVNDYEIGFRHHLKSIDIFNDDGTMSKAAGLYIGMDRFAVREAIIPDLQAAGNLVKIEDYDNKVGYSERTNVVIEPKLSMQWFLKMKELARPALEAVMEDKITLTPSKYKNTYRYWMENVKDWCISRQLWWGHRIPVYYLPDSHDFVVAESPEEAVIRVKKQFNIDLTAESLRQDDDCLDTWFSSWLWPISVFDGILHPDNADISYYYPTNDLVSGPDILFFWMARMIMAGYEYRGEKPFKNLYLTGIVRDKLRRKMSKSLGNSPDPITLIEKYGADGVRVGMLLCSPAGGDLLFDESLPEQGRNFTTKIWNAFRLVSGWEVADTVQPEHTRLAIAWYRESIAACRNELDHLFEQYRISEALNLVYSQFRDEFSSWFLEIIKPAFGSPMDRTSYEAIVDLFEETLQVLHPFMPFITEEVWQDLRTRKEGESIMISLMPQTRAVDEALLSEFNRCREVVVAVRNLRKAHNIALKESVELLVKQGGNFPAEFQSVISKMGNLSAVKVVEKAPAGALGFVADGIEYFVPFAEEVDTTALAASLQKDLDYTIGFLSSVQKKLSNERFVANAPAAVIENERKKMQDAEAKISALKAQIANLQ